MIRFLVGFFAGVTATIFVEANAFAGTQSLPYAMPDAADMSITLEQNKRVYVFPTGKITGLAEAIQKMQIALGNARRWPCGGHVWFYKKTEGRRGDRLWMTCSGCPLVDITDNPIPGVKMCLRTEKKKE